MPNVLRTHPEVLRADVRRLFKAALLVPIFFAGAGFAQSQSEGLSPGRTGGQIENAPENSALHDELGRLTDEIDTLRGSIRDLRTQQRSFEGEVERTEQEIQRTELSITRSQLAVAEIEQEIGTIEEEIAVHEDAIARQYTTLAVLIRSIAERDETSVALLIFSSSTFSDVADHLAANRRIQEEVLSAIASLHDVDRLLKEQEGRLEQRRQSEEEARLLLVIERDELRIKRELRELLLRAAESGEHEASTRLFLHQIDAARIRQQLYKLDDLDEVLSFEEAFVIVEPLAAITGIRPAFLLAVLQKESRLGALTGTGFWRTDMHPRDWLAFIEVTNELGLDPDLVPVSRKPSYGWGGAMGPAQFLPSTWLAYRERISELTENVPPSPWSVEDAFAAAAIKLAAGGATARTASAEWRAAMVYFAGGNWRNPAYAFYGDAVEDLTAKFQVYIDIIEDSEASAGAVEDTEETL